MSWYTRIVAASLMSVGIALLVSLLIKSESGNDKAGNVLAVFLQNKGMKMSDQNVVELIAELPLKLRIQKVDWQQSVLSIDLQFTPENHADAVVYHDLYLLSQFGLTQTANVNQVLVRVMTSQSSTAPSKQLLLAMDARRENIQRGEKQKTDGNPDIWKIYLQTHYRLTLTQQWKNQFSQ